MTKKIKKTNNKNKTKKLGAKNEAIMTNNELTNLLKITLIICSVLLVFYFITVLLHKNDKGTSDSSSNEVAVIQYKKILVGEILNRKEKEYYVLVGKENDPYIDLYTQYLDSDNKTTYYTVDLSDVFNQNSLSDKTILEGNEVDTYKFADTTLIKVVDSKISGVYSEHDKIISYLKSL